MAKKQITSIDKAIVQKMREEVLKVLNRNLEPLGMAATWPNISFNAAMMEGKLKIVVMGDQENAQDARDKVEFEKYAFQYGLKASDFKKQIKSLGSTYELRYFKPRSRNPIIAKKLEDGKLYKMPVSLVLTKGK